jgi:hypothetical protein
METYISFIHHRFNSYPEESICIGMIMIDSKTNKYIARLSDIKLKLLKKVLINKGCFKAFKINVEQLITYPELSVKYIDRLHRYQNGILKIDKPSGINTSLDSFDSLFEKRIEGPFKINN